MKEQIGSYLNVTSQRIIIKKVLHIRLYIIVLCAVFTLSSALRLLLMQRLKVVLLTIIVHGPRRATSIFRPSFVPWSDGL